MLGNDIIAPGDKLVHMIHIDGDPLCYVLFSKIHIVFPGLYLVEIVYLLPAPSVP